MRICTVVRSFHCMYTCKDIVAMGQLLLYEVPLQSGAQDIMPQLLTPPLLAALVRLFCHNVIVSYQGIQAEKEIFVLCDYHTNNTVNSQTNL